MVQPFEHPPLVLGCVVRSLPAPPVDVVAKVFVSASVRCTPAPLVVNGARFSSIILTKTFNLQELL